MSEPMTWQPMATAPKDGTHILVWFPQSGVWEVFMHRFDQDDTEGWWCVSDNKNEPMPLRGWVIQPTHWMPLPAPPVGEMR